MGTKNTPGEYDCHGLAEADEPNFTLVARDRDAPASVELWALHRALAVRRGDKPRDDLAKVEEALQCADAMRSWYLKRRGLDCHLPSVHYFEAKVMLRELRLGGGGPGLVVILAEEGAP